MLTNCYRRGKIDQRYSDTYNKLREIRNQLEKLELTRSWSMREIDLYGYQRQLDRIDESRVDGNFLDAEGNPADLHSQRVGFFNYGDDLFKLTIPDTSLPHPPQLRSYMVPSHCVGTSLGSFVTNLQSTPNSPSLSRRSAEKRRSLLTARTLPIQHEGKGSHH